MKRSLRVLGAPCIFVGLFVAACQAPEDDGESADSAIVNAAPPPEGDCEGSWTAPVEVADAPGAKGAVVGIHTTLLKTGKVFLFGLNPQNPGETESRIFDPGSGEAHAPQLAMGGQPNMFCAGHTVLSDGRVLIAGGSNIVVNRVHVYDPASDTLSEAPPMAMGRWYPTVAPLPETNKAFIIGGTTQQAESPMNDTYEIVDGVNPGQQVALPIPFTPDNPHIGLYPFVQLLPSGILAVHSLRTTRLFEIASQAWLPNQYPQNYKNPRTYPTQGTSVLLPLDAANDYAPEILLIGGGGDPAATEAENPTVEATRSVESIKLGSLDAKWEQRQQLNKGRVMPDSVLLPDGTVLVVNGSGHGFAAGFAADPIREAEQFDPQANTWKTLCPATTKRLYHASAILLPDARVLVAGSDGQYNPDGFKEHQTNVEIFSPPYLKKGNNRPKISKAPAKIGYDADFGVGAEGTIASAMLIRPGSTTHSNNMAQRAVKLAISAPPDGNVTLRSPPNPNVAPPGTYMLFLVSDKGVPSIAKFVTLGAE